MSFFLSQTILKGIGTQFNLLTVKYTAGILVIKNIRTKTNCQYYRVLSKAGHKHTTCLWMPTHSINPQFRWFSSLPTDFSKTLLMAWWLKDKLFHDNKQGYNAFAMYNNGAFLHIFFVFTACEWVSRCLLWLHYETSSTHQDFICMQLCSKTTQRPWVNSMCKTDNALYVKDRKYMYLIKLKG